ncbi:ribosome small subunit-dependent GTPase A [Gordonia sp. CPCC 205515]|uniref:ribosome small subunit-dependent GTPase A n=1 Tax=Gordonia sp. CPCC 205515 TaxID=3140791 RepID=UPI003AF34AFC
MFHHPNSSRTQSISPDRTLSTADYGWDDERERSFVGLRADGLIPGRVVRTDRGRCDIVTDAGPVRASVRPPSNADDGRTSSTGDWVALSPATADAPAVVEEVLDRRTVVVRATASRTSHGQVLAANVDTVAVVVSLSDRVRPGRIERLLTLAWESGATPVVVLTKGDLCADTALALAEVTEVTPGVQVILTSASHGNGLDELVEALTGTIVLLGPSGVGKSTLGNRLLGEDLLATGAVRDSDGKGRHTTAWRELLPLPHGGVLLDTPGLRGIGIPGADDGLDRTFAEFTELAQACRFADCAHVAEPGCAVLAAVEAGDITRRRVDNFHRLQRENAHAQARTDARLRAELERSRKEISRHIRALKRSPNFKS